MPGRLIISRFALLTGLSAKTLRYYDEIGLLRPAEVDPLSSYRYYSVTQLGQGIQIRRWRTLRLPLDDIRHLTLHPDHAPEVLAQHEQRLNAEIQERQKALAQLRQALQEAPMDYRTEHLAARQILSIRTRLSPPHYEVIPEALREVTGYAKAQGYHIQPPSFFIHDQDGQGEGSLVEVCLPVAGRVTGAGRIEVRTFEGGPAFVGRFVGPYDRTGAAYSLVAEEALRRGLRLTGVTAEFYVKSVPHTPNPEEYETDIAFFLEPEEEPQGENSGSVQAGTVL